MRILDRRSMASPGGIRIGPHFCLGAGLARLELRVARRGSFGKPRPDTKLVTRQAPGLPFG